MHLPKITAALLIAAPLSSCGPRETPPAAQVPSVEALAADPIRLKELRQQCRADRPKMGDLLCNRVAEATNRRFLGDGNVPCTPPKEPPKF